ncbi:SusC/RagA family TonB-linked outer membrane protein [Dokdonia sinensis]|uniref:SusC/RagA family TonB-linked outer membrane protein n=1 Tax=Dokdonia sinensis TaxID=2479847 RepID=A0A3M0GZN9_9FLAO|nr:SusC/RagA family TonB-linked outer membrane protein [Dokdonia sinensis]RMB62806.1 SusC/RagA family TonB-linked outer membrane protein [Dokdonia sinensis]
MKTKFSGILTLLLAFVVQMTFAQQKTVSGTVTADGGPLPGANVIIKGTSTGTQTDFDGNYTIQASATDVIAFSFVGYSTKEVTVGAQSTINVTLEGDNALEEVIVTAQGIKREKKALGYAVTSIGADALSSKPSTDAVRALTGKAPGVNIQQTSGLAGSGTNIIIRGFSSISLSNQPLFIVDGVPFNSDTNNDRGFQTGGATASSRFLDLDPNNIEELSVLKGIAATTLYGSQGRNGVILITTKSGSAGENANKKLEISVTNSYFATEIANLPDYQNNYGNGFYQAYSQAFSNWGPNFNTRGQLGVAEDGTVTHPYDRAALAGSFPEFQGARYDYRPYNSVERFFRTGNVVTNSVNAQGANGDTSYSLNVGRTNDEGFTVNNDYKRLNFGLGGKHKFSNGFTVSSSFNVVRTDRNTPPAGISFGSNPAGASLFSNVLYTPRSVDLLGLPFEDPVTRESVYYRGGNDIQNPRWTLKNINDNEQVRRFFGNISTNYDLNDWSSLNYRITLDQYTQVQEFKANKGGPQINGGSLTTSTRLNTVWDHTLSYNFSRDISEKFNIGGTVGFNARRETRSSRFISSTQQFVYGLFNHSNFEETTASSFESEENIFGAYASIIFDYDNFLFFNAQARNDWSSTLEAGNNSLLYPSASVSFVPTSAFEGLRASNAINFLKFRLSYGESAGFPPPYRTRVGLNAFANAYQDPRDGSTVNALGISGRLGQLGLLPERIQELEAGVEARFFGNRLGIDLSVYKKTSSDLIVDQLLLDPSTGYSVTSGNTAEVENEGLELGFNFSPIKGADANSFNWDVSGQYTINENIVVETAPGLEDGFVIPGGGFTNLGNFAIPGQPYGVIQGTSIARDDNGQPIVASDGNYLANNDNTIIADPNADWRGTVINEFSWKGLSFQFQLEYQHGGDIYSTTAAALLSRGLTTDTDFDRTQTYVLPGVNVDANGVSTPNNVQITATDLGFVNSGFFIDEQAIYDATHVRLREVSLSYSLPKKFLEKTPFGRMSISLIGQNLWFKAVNVPEGLNFDPEVQSLGVGNGQGFDFLTGPTAKRYGFNLNVTF